MSANAARVDLVTRTREMGRQERSERSSSHTAVADPRILTSIRTRAPLRTAFGSAPDTRTRPSAASPDAANGHNDRLAATSTTSQPIRRDLLTRCPQRSTRETRSQSQ